MMIKPLVILLLVSCQWCAAQSQPDVVIVFADDFGWGEIGEHALTPTPHIDRMAQEGTRFTQGYVASPICSPSRCGLLTGQHPSKWHILSFLQARKGNKACGQADFLDAAAPALPRMLLSGGYATAHIGKWHLGGGRDVTDAPKFAAYGYNIGLGTYESPEPHPDITATDWIWSEKDPVKRWQRSRWMVDQTLTFLEQHADKPCFVNLWLDDTHTPWVPTLEAQDDKSQFSTPAALSGVVKEMDIQIGRLLERLAARKRPVIVFFLGDNGPLPTFDGKRAGGLRGSKLSLYEGGTRVPFIAWGPGIVAAGRIDNHSVVSALDIVPTCLALTGVPLPNNYLSDGQDISAALQGATITREKPLFYDYGRNPKAYKYPKEPDRSPNLAMRDGHWKFLINDDGTAGELYNLNEDINELTNVAAAHPDIAERMQTQLLMWRASLP